MDLLFVGQEASWPQLECQMCVAGAQCSILYVLDLGRKEKLTTDCDGSVYTENGRNDREHFDGSYHIQGTSPAAGSSTICNRNDHSGLSVLVPWNRIPGICLNCSDQASL